MLKFYIIMVKLIIRSGKRIIYLRSIVGECNKSVIQQIFQNIYLLDCQDLSDDGIEKKLNFIRKYMKNCDAMLMGYSSTLMLLGDILISLVMKKRRGVILVGLWKVLKCCLIIHVCH